MRPALVLSTGNCQTLLLVSLDPGWIPLGECTPLSLAKCVLVIPLSESNEMCLKMTALVYWEMGRKGFPEYGLWNPKCIRQKCCTSKSGKCILVDSSVGI